MRRVEAKIVENRKEDPASEPDQDRNTWLIEAKLDEDILDSEKRATRLSIFRDRRRNCCKQYVKTRPLHGSYTR
jgi:hypothetical protein